MTIQKLTKESFNETQERNYPLGAFYYTQELDPTITVYQGLIVTNQYQLFAEFTKLTDLESWANQEFPSLP